MTSGLKQLIGVAAECGIGNLPTMGANVLQEELVIAWQIRPRKIDDPPRAVQRDLIETSPLVSLTPDHSGCQLIGVIRIGVPPGPALFGCRGALRAVDRGD